MKKNRISLFAMTLIMALGMNQSVMANDGMAQCKLDEACIMNDTIKSDVSYKVSHEKVIFPQGFYLKMIGSSWEVMLPDSTTIWDENVCHKKIGELVGIKKLKNPSITSIHFSKSLGISNLSEDEVTKLIKEKLAIVWPDCDFNTNDFYQNRIRDLSYYGLNKPQHLDVFEESERGYSEIGFFFDGHYYTKETLNKKKEAKEAAAEKSFKAEIAKFKNKYGFDPVNTPWRQIIKAGRSEAAFNACNKFLKEHGYVIMGVKLTIDNGASKCYNMYKNDIKQGSFWTRGGRITSVVWR